MLEIRAQYLALVLDSFVLCSIMCPIQPHMRSIFHLLFFRHLLFKLTLDLSLAVLIEFDKTSGFPFISHSLEQGRIGKGSATESLRLVFVAVVEVHVKFKINNYEKCKLI